MTWRAFLLGNSTMSAVALVERSEAKVQSTNSIHGHPCAIELQFDPIEPYSASTKPGTVPAPFRTGIDTAWRSARSSEGGHTRFLSPCGRRSVES